ncbi:MAG: hypothetical protein KDE04_15700 [Anaerolineales bacterium]|nr:hypothetical protein [Anaerolineales bacterium]
MVNFFFGLGFGSGLTLVGLSLASLWRPGLQFWPPPAPASWQARYFWWAFRLLLLGLVVVSVLDFRGAGPAGAWTYWLGIPLALLGIGLAFAITFQLGWRDAHGEAQGLKTGGWYRFSRNPIYVVTLVGLLGVGLVVHSVYAYLLLFLWAALYLVAPFLEEPWLEAQYGADYRQYKARVPRFIGWPKAARPPA